MPATVTPAADKRFARGHQADAEVGEADPRTAGWFGLADEEVRGLEVLVEDAGVVGRGERFGRLRGDLDAVGERHRADAALAVRPRQQIAGFGVRGLEEEGRSLELPVEHLRDVAPLAEPLAQEPQENDLALEAAQARRLEAELEHSPRAGLVVGRQPDFADRAGAELLDQTPVLAAGNQQADRRAPAQRQLVAGGDRAARLLGVRRRFEGRDARRSPPHRSRRVVPAL